MSPAAIDRLAPELLLNIFQSIAQDPHHRADIASLARCCKAWYPLARSVLYGHIAVRDQRLVEFAYYGDAADGQICSLSLRMDLVRVNPYNPDPANKLQVERVKGLRQIARRVAKMGSLTSFSIRADQVSQPLVCQVLDAVSLIVDNLPASCVSLEVDITGVERGATGFSHICPSVRRTLARLEHLRLRLPWICPALCRIPAQEISSAAGDKDDYEAVSTPRLEDCIINAALLPPSPYSHGAHTMACPVEPNTAPTRALESRSPTGILAALEAFCARNPNVTRFWFMDSQNKPADPPNTWAAWIRRDFRTKQSFPLPTVNIGGFEPDREMVRLPRGDGTTEDWMSSASVLEELAEGSTWTETAVGVRLPKSVMEARGLGRLAPAIPMTLFRNGADWQPWSVEEETGQSVLPVGPGPLMQVWDLQEKPPKGWRRHNYERSLMVKEK